jgi:hypothetical protein
MNCVTGSKNFTVNVTRVTCACFRTERKLCVMLSMKSVSFKHEREWREILTGMNEYKNCSCFSFLFRTDWTYILLLFSQTAFLSLVFICRPDSLALNILSRLLRRTNSTVFLSKISKYAYTLDLHIRDALFKDKISSLRIVGLWCRFKNV